MRDGVWDRVSRSIIIPTTTTRYDNSMVPASALSHDPACSDFDPFGPRDDIEKMGSSNGVAYDTQSLLRSVGVEPLFLRIGSAADGLEVGQVLHGPEVRDLRVG